MQNVYATEYKDYFVVENDMVNTNLNPKNEEKDLFETYFRRERDLLVNQLEVITGDEETRYIIVPGDTLLISYMDRKDRKVAAYKISGEGKIHMPLIGQVKLTGLNRKQIREKLNALLGEYIKSPNVDVRVNVTGRYMVLGAVIDPGLFVLQKDLTLLEAILIAGGFDEDTANKKSVLVLRGGNDNPVVTRLNLHKMIKKGDRTDNIPIKPGDLVYVPTSFIANLEEFQKTLTRYVAGYYGVLDTHNRVRE
ncbi:MAG: polysaccharide biosynthesis/export family protein [Candidatus Omnitrophica bacterium]|nr:polysaccharide biosynthesis/export family protein [Candidatus Omnitrophota bacterium]